VLYESAIGDRLSIFEERLVQHHLTASQPIEHEAGDRSGNASKDRRGKGAHRSRNKLYTPIRLISSLMAA
jgi:hypothetical protein